MIVVNDPQFVNNEIKKSTKTKNEHQRSVDTEKMHRAFAEFGDKRNRKQVEKSVDKSFETEFGCSVFSRLVRNAFLSNVDEAGTFGNYRNITMHFAVHFDAFHHIAAVSF